MDGEGGKGLGRPLAETDVAETPRLGGVEDVGDGIRDVVPGEIVQRVVPKLFRVRIMVDALL